MNRVYTVELSINTEPGLTHTPSDHASDLKLKRLL